ncbi:MAG: hypothetical protein JWM14_865 [Chitinophagaceae bacterium]|nr:hypothetical protein [Chitinophagaceae bacterium]
MKLSLLLPLLLLSCSIHAQTSYKGFIGKYPIELVTNIYSDGVANAIYSYSNYDEPIAIVGELKAKKLILFEKGTDNKNTASLTFDNFDPKSKTIEGIWLDLNTKKQLNITLTKLFDFNYGDAIEWTNQEMMQPVSLPGHYFKLVTSKMKDEFYAKVTAVKIYEKKTDKLIQTLEMDCQLWGLNNISVDDFNFDGINDFSVFESSYAGPNTSSLYFLFDPKTNTYFESSFSGISLEFDNNTKRISEHNQCCAGRQHTMALYKVVDNEMVLVEQHCYIWDEEKEDLVERNIKECE